MVFTGTYEHSIDQKNRLAIPAEIRSQIQRDLGEGQDGAVSVYVVAGGSDRAGSLLSLYTEESFEKQAARLDESQQEPEDVLEYETLVFSLARKVELDKQGRIRLPESLKQRAGLGSDVVILGAKDHVEIRDRASWNAYVEQRLRERPDLLRNPRLAMRQRGDQGNRNA